MDSSKEELLMEINNHLAYSERSWSEFLISDCQEFVESLHTYRLQHLLDNQQAFIEYIDILEKDYLTMIEDETLEPQSQATIQALFLLSCVEFASASKERMIIREMVKEGKE